MRGHPGPFGRRCAWQRRRVLLVLDVVVPEDLELASLQYHLARCVELAMQIAGTRGEQIGCAVGETAVVPKNQPLCGP